MSAGSTPVIAQQGDQNQLLSGLINELIQIRDQRDAMAEIDCRARKAEVCQVFAESQLPFVKEGDEYSDYICQLRAKSIAQRLECEKALKNKLDNDTLTKVRENIREADIYIGALLENIVMVLNPELLHAIDAAI